MVYFFRLGRRFWAASATLVAAALMVGAAVPEGNLTVSGFDLPGFGPDGYKAWDIQGREARTSAASPDEIAIAGLRLRLYSSGPTPALETTIESPEALAHPREDQAGGPGFIYIRGASYNVTGNEWTWDGKQRVIRVNHNVMVVFAASASAATPTPGATAAAAQPINIHSDTLEIHQQPDRNQFLFSGNVTVTDSDGETMCRALDVLAARSAESDAPENSSTAGPAPSGIAVGRVENITARDNVVMLHGDLQATAREAVMVPSEQSVVLSGSPKVRDSASDAVLEGGRITWWRDRQEVEVEPAEVTSGELARVRVSLPPLSSYHVDTGATPEATPGPNGPRLVITGESLHAHFGEDERRFDVERSVRVEDPQLTVESDHLDAEFNPPAPVSAGTSATPGAPAPEIGQLKRLAVQGNVVVYQENRIAVAQQGEIFPPTKQIVLSGKPRVEDSLSHAVITGNVIKLYTDIHQAEVEGTADTRAELVLPSLPGLGEVVDSHAETHITSDGFAMKRSEQYSDFDFEGQVRVAAQDLNATCGQLLAHTRNAAAPGPAAADDQFAGVGQVGDILEMVASRQVDIHERGFEAKAARAEIYPQEPAGGNATASDVPAEPHRFVELYGDPAGVDGPKRPEVVLAPLEDLGWDTAAPGNETTSGNATATPRQPTVISSDEQRLFTSPAGDTYLFKNHVEIDGDNFQATCDQMKVLAASTPVSGNTAAGAPASSGIKSIVAQDNVRITQGVRVATAGMAEIDPVAGTIELSQNPAVTDTENGGHTEGDRIELRRGERAAHILSAPGEQTQSTFVEPAMNLDNVGKPQDKTPSGTSP